MPVVALAALALAMAGCGPEVALPSATSDFPRGTVVPSCEAAQDDVLRFRVQYGLQADNCWIAAVASDPSAQQGVGEFGIPLMPFELVELRDRHTDTNLLQEINRYGSLFPESFAGAYMDYRASQAFIASFKDDAARHKVALANLLPTAHVEVFDVDWSSIELDQFVKVVAAEQPWFATIGVQYLTADRAITENFVSLDYLGPVAAAQTIEEHFGSPTWLIAERQGPLPWTGARGELVILVVDENGRPVPGLRCDFVPEDPEAGNPIEGISGTDDNGHCSAANLPAVPYLVTLNRFVNNDHYEPIKEFRVVLVPGGTTTTVEVQTP